MQAFSERNCSNLPSRTWTGGVLSLSKKIVIPRKRSSHHIHSDVNRDLDGCRCGGSHGDSGDCDGEIGGWCERREREVEGEEVRHCEQSLAWQDGEVGGYD